MGSTFYPYLNFAPQFKKFKKNFFYKFSVMGKARRLGLLEAGLAFRLGLTHYFFFCFLSSVLVFSTKYRIYLNFFFIKFFFFFYKKFRFTIFNFLGLFLNYGRLTVKRGKNKLSIFV